MPRIGLQERIHTATDIHHGEPCIAGTRIPVALIVGSMADGMSTDEVIREYPQLKPVDIYAALAYAADSVRHELLVPLA